MTEFCQRKIIMKSWIVLCELLSWPTAQETGEGYAIVMPRRTGSGIYFRIIPVSLANMAYQSDGHETVRIARKKYGCPRWRNHRGGMQMNGAFRVEGIAVMEGKCDSYVMNRPVRFSMRRIILHAMPSTYRHPCMIACRSEWRLLAMKAYGCGLAVQWDVFMISPLNAMALPVRAADTHRKRDSDRSWIVLRNKDEARYDMFANVHGWIVRSRFRTACGTMNWIAVSRMDVLYWMRGECEEWDVMMLTPWPAMRYATRRWLRVRSAGHVRQGLAAVIPVFMLGWFRHAVHRIWSCRSSIPDPHRFHSKLRLISKKRAAVTVRPCFFLIPRVTLLDGAVSWGAERNAGNVRFAYCSSLLRELIGKWEHNILSYLHVHIVNEAVMKQWCYRSRTGLFLLGYRRIVNIIIIIDFNRWITQDDVWLEAVVDLCLQ